MLHAVIMAGGSGTRFWPASRNAVPKQLLNLVGPRTMIQSTVDRLDGLVPRERTSIVTNQSLVSAIRAQLPELPDNAVIGEPCKRDTAPCVGLAAALIAERDPDATMIVMPSDHVIQDVDAFHLAVHAAEGLLDESPSRLVTFGIRPTYAAEGFGYIERDERLARAEVAAYQVKMFREKPTAEIAEQYLASGDFYWNSGIFVWRVRAILEALAELEPAMHGHLTRIAQTFEDDRFADTLREEFTAIRGKSIDYAVLEKHADVVVIEAPFDWDDVGNWRSLARQRGVDDQGNTVVGRHLSVDSHGCIVRGDQNHLIVTLGMSDCVIVHTPDATLVARKQDEESVRKIVEMLREKGWTEYL